MKEKIKELNFLWKIELALASLLNILFFVCVLTQNHALAVICFVLGIAIIFLMRQNRKIHHDMISARYNAVVGRYFRGLDENFLLKSRLRNMSLLFEGAYISAVKADEPSETDRSIRCAEKRMRLRHIAIITALETIPEKLKDQASAMLNQRKIEDLTDNEFLSLFRKLGELTDDTRR